MSLTNNQELPANSKVAWAGAERKPNPWGLLRVLCVRCGRWTFRPATSNREPVCQTCRRRDEEEKRWKV